MVNRALLQFLRFLIRCR